MQKLSVKMLQDEETLPVNVYLVIVSPLVNQSGLRIDEVASADDYVGNVANYLDMVNNWVSEHLAAVKENLEKQSEEK